MNQPEQTPRKNRAPFFLAILLVGLAVITISAYLIPILISPQNAAGKATYNDKVFRVLPSPGIAVPNVTLTSMNDKPLTLDQFKGKWTFLYFGYTLCPDICPLELTALAGVAEDLRTHPPAKPVDWQMMFVSVDPDRDSLQKIKSFVNYYDPAIMGATATEDVLRTMATPLGIGWEKTGVKMPNGKINTETYLINHSTTILLINPEGRLVAVFPTPHHPKEMVTEFEKYVSHH